MTKPGPTQADVLIELALEAELFHAPDGTGFADLDIDCHRETWPIRARGFRRWLARRFYEAALRLMPPDHPERALLLYRRAVPVGPHLGGADPDQIAEALTGRGLTAVDLQGSLSQRVRERNLARFAAGEAQVVVATDVAARGIHVDDVGLVVHFDAAGDAKSYLHRSGRTARAGNEGCVVTLTTPRLVAGVVRIQQGAGVDEQASRDERHAEPR